MQEIKSGEAQPDKKSFDDYMGVLFYHRTIGIEQHELQRFGTGKPVGVVVAGLWLRDHRKAAGHLIGVEQARGWRSSVP
ncbi:MAG: hypothetical protein R3E68_01655 [Burkholderiaceae bacterium]